MKKPPDLRPLRESGRESEAKGSSLANEEVRHSAAFAEEELLTRRQDREERKRYASRIFVLACLWLAVVVAVIGLAGFRLWSFELPVGGLVALIASTTFFFLGMFAVVARSLFPARSGGRASVA